MKNLFVLLLSMCLLPIYSQSSAENRHKLGQIKMNAGYFQEAIKEFNAAIKANPLLWQAYLDRSKSKLALSDSKAAMADIEKALELNRKVAEIFFIRAKINNSLLEYNKAMSDLDEALKLKPDYKEAFSEKMFTLFYQKKENEAFAQVEQELRKKESSMLYYTRGVLLNIKGKHSKAAADFTKALSLDTTTNAFEIYLNRSLAYFSSDDQNKALKDINIAIQKKPGHPSGYTIRGKVYYSMKEYSKAQNDFQRVNKINPDDSFILFNLGMSCLKMDSVVQACGYFRESCKLGNQNACKMAIVECSKM